MQKLIKDLIIRNDTKLFLLILDGLGGLPVDGRTELEAADTPNMDKLARSSACGLHIPVAPGITPGSGPGHLGVFGYNPTECMIGRGVLEALGLGMEVRKTDVAVRCNYSTMGDGVIKDRRAGRIPTEQSAKITERLRSEIKKIDEAEVFFGAGMEHRFAVVFRFPEPLEKGSDAVNDTDPQKTGLEPLEPVASTPAADKVARVCKNFIARTTELLKDEPAANHLLLRGISLTPDIPTFEEAFGLKALAIATYPMYRGLAKLIGMEAPELEGTVRDEIDYLKANLNDYDFFFVHIKKVDSYGEDGNFKGKAERIMEVDEFIPEILAMKPDVLAITGDHSTPALMKGHSWHPVPLLLHSQYVLGEVSQHFSERECLKGELGIFPSVSLLPLMLANSGRLKKYGA